MKKIDKPLYVHLGQQLKEARLKKHYSLQDVADIVGRNRATIKRYEDAEVRIDMETLDALCTALDVKPTPIYISTGDTIVERIILDPNTDEHELLPYEDGYEESVHARLSEEMFKKFLELDENAQRIVLMMLKMDDIDGIMTKLH